MLKVIVKNGAPRSGKGIAAKHMTDLVNNSEEFLTAFHMEFKDELFKVAANTLGISVEDFLHGYDKTVGELYEDDEIGLNFALMDEGVTEESWVKDCPWYQVNDTVMSKRQWFIHMSENVIKPSFGASAFGDMFVNSMPEEGLVFCSDSGFPEELQPVIDHVGVENVLVVRIHRDGCTYEGDSRSMLTEDMFEENSCPAFTDVYNNGSEEQFKAMITFKIGAWLNE